MSDAPGTFADLLRDIRRRLRPVCAEMPEAEFKELTTQMAEVEMKYRQRVAFEVYGPIIGIRTRRFFPPSSD